MFFSVLVIALKVLLLPSARAADGCEKVVAFEEMEKPLSPKFLNTRGVINFVRELPIYLSVKYEIPVYATKQYEGELRLADANDEIGKKTSPGKPYSAKYYLYFEKGLPLPTMTLVEVNDKTLCRGPSITARNKTIIFRKHSLTWSERNSVIIKTGPSTAKLVHSQNNTVDGVPVDKLFLFHSPRRPVEQYHHNPFLHPSKNPGVGTEPILHSKVFFADPVGHYHSNPFLYPTENPTPTARPTPRPTPRPTAKPTQRPKPTTPKPARPPATLGPPNSPFCHGNDSKRCCGISAKPVHLVVNGLEANREEFRWMVPLYRRNASVAGDFLQYICSSTLISDNYILTAAHCVKWNREVVEESRFVAAVGMFELDNWSDQDVQKREIHKIYIHPDYNGHQDADIALLKLNRRVVFGSSVIPACIWREDDDLDAIVGRKSIAFGWGRDETGRITEKPNFSLMPIVSQWQCTSSNFNFHVLTSNRTLCAGTRDGSGPCRGDSGGGLVLLRRDRDGRSKWFLRGIVSTALKGSDITGCDLSNYIIFSDVAKFRRWLSVYVQIF